MDTIEVFRTALSAVRTNKIRSFLTTLGVVIGVASVILLVAIGAGLQRYVTDEFEALGSNILFISPGKVQFSGGPPRNVEAKFDFDDIRNLERLGDPIIDAGGMIVKGGTLKYRSKSFYASIAGVGEDYLNYGNVEIESGKFFTSGMVERSQKVGVIGNKVYTELFRSGENALDKEIDVAGTKVVVIGVLKEKGGGFGGSESENNYVFLPITTAIKVTGIDKPAAAMVRTKDAESVSLAAKKVKDYFYKKNLTDDDFTVLEPKELLDTIKQFLGVVTAALSGIAAISLVVGGIGIANIMLVSVTERTREIGLRKAIGATKRDILIQFLVEAMMLSLLGGVIGISMGWGFAELMKQIIQTEVTVNSVVLAFGISAVVGIVSGIAPAIRAGNLNPIDALRYE